MADWQRTQTGAIPPHASANAPHRRTAASLPTRYAVGVRTLLRRGGRWASPGTLILAMLCFLLPFATVSCDTPGGFGRAAPGGTTTYTGLQLALGAEPDVSPPDRVRPPAESRDARLWPQPGAIAVLMLLVAATALAIRVGERRARRAYVGALTGVAAVALLVNQALVEAELALRLGEQLTQPLPAGKVVRDFVHTGVGFALCLVLLLVITAANVVGWWRTRARPALVAGEHS